MILRIAAFLSLLALFYNYCDENNNIEKLRSPNDINMIEVPQEISPSFLENPSTAFNSKNDSLYITSSEYLQKIEQANNY